MSKQVVYKGHTITDSRDGGLAAVFSVVQQAHEEPKRTGRKTRDDLQRERAAICEREGHKQSEFRSGSNVLIYCRRCMVKL